MNLLAGVEMTYFKKMEPIGAQLIVLLRALREEIDDALREREQAQAALHSDYHAKRVLVAQGFMEAANYVKHEASTLDGQDWTHNDLDLDGNGIRALVQSRLTWTAGLLEGKAQELLRSTCEHDQLLTHPCTACLNTSDG